MTPLHNPAHVCPRASILAVMRRRPGVEVTGYDIATAAHLTAKRATHYLSDLAARGDVVRVHAPPRPGTREVARYRLAEGAGVGS